jgi:hypothetical protein
MRRRPDLTPPPQPNNGKFFSFFLYDVTYYQLSFIIHHVQCSCLVSLVASVLGRGHGWTRIPAAYHEHAKNIYDK